MACHQPREPRRCKLREGTVALNRFIALGSARRRRVSVARAGRRSAETGLEFSDSSACTGPHITLQDSSVGVFSWRVPPSRCSPLPSSPASWHSPGRWRPSRASGCSSRPATTTRRSRLRSPGASTATTCSARGRGRRCRSLIGDAFFNILPPGSSDVAIYNSSIDGNGATAIRLPASGDYTIRVYLMGAAESETARCRSRSP
jgi:hypothetical protein